MKIEQAEILHVACFSGNSGDHLNHEGFCEWLNELAKPVNLIWNRLELREVWRGDRDLYARLARESQGNSLIVFGGGNFWETWDENSASGTSLNVTYSQLSQLGIPVFFNSLSVETARGVSANARSTFLPDLAKMAGDSSFFVTVRNDGSRRNLFDLGFDLPAGNVLPDHGLFTKLPDVESGVQDEISVAINLAIDMPEIRYRGFSGPEEFFAHMAHCIENVGREIPLSLKFIAHVPSDISAFNYLVASFSDAFLRGKVKLYWEGGAYDPSLTFARHYLTSDVVISQRFHSTILGLRSNARTLCVSNHPQLSGLFDELGSHEGVLLPIERAADFPQFDRTLLLLGRSAQSSRSEKSLDAASPPAVAQRSELGNKLRGWLGSEVFSKI